MTKPWRVDVLQCRGSSYEIGRQMAEGFLKTARGRAYGRREERKPFGDAQPETTDFAARLRGVDQRARRQGATVRCQHAHIGTRLDGALFNDVLPAGARSANISLAGAVFDDIDFSGASIAANCNFRGMTIAGVPV